MPTGIDPDTVAPIEIGPGCYRRDLPTAGGVRVWIVDMEPGSIWPYVDHHGERGEEVYIVHGELIEGERRFSAGTYLLFGANSAHQPRTESGVRLFGINVL